MIGSAQSVISPNLAPAATGIISGIIGAIVGGFITLRLNRKKHFQEMRSGAYADFLRGWAKVAIAQNDSVRDARSFLEEREGMVTVADAKGRIAIYGSKQVVQAMSFFIRHGSQTHDKEGMKALSEICRRMREESAGEGTATEDVNTLLFSEGLDGA